MVPAPGSYIAQKGEYAIVKDHLIAEAPEWLLKRLGEPKTKRAEIEKQANREKLGDRTKPIIEENQQGRINEAIQVARNAEPAIHGSGGDSVTYNLACRLRDFALSKAIVHRIMLRYWNDRCSPPWTFEELKVKVNNAFNYAQSAPGERLASSDFSEVIVEGSGGADDLISAGYKVAQFEAFGGAATKAQKVNHTFNNSDSTAEHTATVKDEIMCDNGTYKCGELSLNVPIIAVEVEIRADGTVVEKDGFIYIKADATMPELKARLLPETLEATPATMQLTIKYDRHLTYLNRNNVEVDVSRHDSDAYPASGKKSLTGIQEWAINSDLNNELRGGLANIVWEYGGTTGNKTFNIRGANPTATDVSTYIDQNNGPWYAFRIASHETSLRQFNTNTANDVAIRNCPNYGAPNGWGIMQLDPPDNAQQLWDWHANITEALDRIENNYADDAGTYWADQMDRYDAFRRSGHPNAPLPNDLTYADITFSSNPTGTQKDYEDAIVIKRYNGLGMTGFQHEFIEYHVGNGAGEWRVYNYAKYWVIEDGERVCRHNYYVRSICYATSGITPAPDSSYLCADDNDDNNQFIVNQ